MSSNNIYWYEKGKYQKAYDYFYPKLVPNSGEAATPEGELLRMISKFYYRFYNDSDLYEELIEDNYLSLNRIKNINISFLKNLHQELITSYNYEKSLEEVVNRILRFIILQNSTADKIFNIDTRRLVSIKTPKGMKILKDLDCQISYQYQL